MQPVFGDGAWSDRLGRCHWVQVGPPDYAWIVTCPVKCERFVA